MKLFNLSVFIVFFTFFSNAQIQSESDYVQILGIVQDAGYPHIGCEKDIVEQIKLVDYALIDGTFYNGLELDRDMSEIPHPSVEETLELFLNQPVVERNKIYFIHINHTNPILTNKNGVKDLIESYGFNVAKRGLKFYL